MKITIVGGASVCWIPVFMKDFCNCPDMDGAQVVLHDLNLTLLSEIKPFCDKMLQNTGANFTVSTEEDLKRSITGADIVICNVLIGGHSTWEKEINRILEYGIAHPKGMSVGPGGMAMGIKQIPYMVALGKLMEEVCPDAWLLNFSNPMQCLTLAVEQNCKIKCIGLCHGVMHSVDKYCEWLKVDRKDVSVKCGGVNHFELVLEMRKDGKDLLPELAEVMDTLQDDGSEFGDITTKEMYKIYGALPSNHDIHSIEFYPHFLKRNVKLADYRLKQNDVGVRISDGLKRLDKIRAYTRGEIPLTDFVPAESTELLEHIVHAIVQNEPMVLTANIQNNGCISNLPDDVCVGVPLVLDKNGYTGCRIGELPHGLDAMQYLHATIQRFIVKAALTGDRSELMKALTLDPMCYDLSFDQRKSLIDDLLIIGKDYLPAFFA